LTKLINLINLAANKRLPFSFFACQGKISYTFVMELYFCKIANITNTRRPEIIPADARAKPG
jgi:hypothetical protein